MRFAPILLAFAFVMLSGCGGRGDRLPTYRADGIVKFPDGRPLAGGIVLCESPHGLAARAVIESDGTFRLGTYDKGDGAVEGKHRATVQPASSGESASAGGAPPRPAMDDRFKDFERSGIVLEVSPSGRNHFEIVISPPPEPVVEPVQAVETVEGVKEVDKR
jgi:hypothetical protein